MILVSSLLLIIPLQHTSLSVFTRWAATWLVTFNPTKNESLLISHKAIKSYHPPLYMHRCQITEVDSHKHLHNYFSSDCSWHQHKVTQKNKINVMKILNSNKTENLFKPFILPWLDIYSILYGTTVHNVKKIN